MSKPLCVFKVNENSRIPSHVGMYAKLSMHFHTGGRVFSVFRVANIEDATIFSKGEVSKRDLPHRGKCYTLVEVTVTEKVKTYEDPY